MKTKYKYIHFLSYPKYDEWECLNNKSGFLLGVVKYYKPWKQYVTEFAINTVFNDQYLNDIADFLKQLNRQI